MNKMKDTEQVIERVNKYLSLLRYKYSSLEKLSRLHIINDYYTTQQAKSSVEHLSCEIVSAEQLSNGLKLPLKVKGTFLSEGRPKAKYYTVDALKKSVDNPLNTKFPLMLDHKDKEAGKIIGMVDKIKYNPRLKKIDWEGHINDETFARNVLDKAITQVSATIFSSEEYDEILGIIGKDLVFKELSLVMAGADKSNSISAY